MWKCSHCHPPQTPFFFCLQRQINILYFWVPHCFSLALFCSPPPRLSQMSQRLWRCCFLFAWLCTPIQLLLHLFTCAELTTSVPGVGGGPRHVGRATVTRIRASTPTVTRRMDTATARWAANTRTHARVVTELFSSCYCCRFFLIARDIIHVKTLELFQLLIAVAVYMRAAVWQLMIIHSVMWATLTSITKGLHLIFLPLCTLKKKHFP